MVIRDLLFAAAGAVTPIDGKTFRYVDGPTKSLTTYSGAVSNIKNLNGQLIVCGAGGISASADGVTWQLYSQVFSAANTAGLTIGWVNDITYDGTQYVIGCDYGITAVSPDLINWTFSTSLQSTTWGATSTYGSIYSICKTSDRFVVCGKNGRLATSTDGLNWTFNAGLRNSAWGWRNPDDNYVTNDVGVVLWVSGRLVAVGGPERLAYSDDNGNTWTFVSSMGSYKSNFYPISLARVNNLWVVGGLYGCYGYSSDGATWTFSAIGSFASNSSYVYSIIYDGSKYIASGGVNGAYGCIATSTNLASWISVSLSSLTSLSTARWYSTLNSSPVSLIMGAIAGVYVVNNTSYGWSARTSDLSSWTENPTFSNPNRVSMPFTVLSVPFLQKLVVGGSGAVSVSGVNDVQNWSLSDFSSQYTNSSYVYGLACNSSIIVAAYLSTTESVFTSTNGANWVKQTGLNSTSWGAKYAYDVKYVPFLSKFVIVGSSGGVALSSDGINWTYASGLSSTGWSTSDCRRVVYSNSQLLVMGASGKVATSTDGLNWVNQTSLSSTSWGTNYVRNGVYDGSKFVVVGEMGCLATSTDGVTWTFNSSVQSTSWGTNVSIRGITYVNGIYIISGSYSGASGFYVQWSKDLTTWTSSTANTNNSLAIGSAYYAFDIFNNSLFLAGSGGVFQNP